MATYVLHSPKHGDLHVVTTERPDEPDRTWVAVLDPAPERLRHVTSVGGMSEEEVLDCMLRTVELYDETPMMPTRRGYPEHDEAAPASGG